MPGEMLEGLVRLLGAEVSGTHLVPRKLLSSSLLQSFPGKIHIIAYDYANSASKFLPWAGCLQPITQLVKLVEMDGLKPEPTETRGAH